MRGIAQGAVIVLVALLTGCASSVMITSEPSGAQVTLDGRRVGTTPYYHTDTKVSGYSLGVQIEKEGYKTRNGMIKKTQFGNTGAIIGGIFIWPVLAWVLEYPAVAHYVLDWDSAALPQARIQEDDEAVAPVNDEIPGILVTIKDAESPIRSVFVVSLDARPCRGTADPLVLEEQASVRLLRRYDVLERRGLDAVLAESQRGMNGLFDEESVVEAGLLAGAEGVVLLRESCLSGQPYYSAKLVECSTGRQVWAGTAEGRSLGMLMDVVEQKLAR